MKRAMNNEPMAGFRVADPNRDCPFPRDIIEERFVAYRIIHSVNAHRLEKRRMCAIGKEKMKTEENNVSIKVRLFQ